MFWDLVPNENNACIFIIIERQISLDMLRWCVPVPIIMLANEIWIQNNQKENQSF